MTKSLMSTKVLINVPFFFFFSKQKNDLKLEKSPNDDFHLELLQLLKDGSPWLCSYVCVKLYTAQTYLSHSG